MNNMPRRSWNVKRSDGWGRAKGTKKKKMRRQEKTQGDAVDEKDVQQKDAQTQTEWGMDADVDGYLEVPVDEERGIDLDYDVEELAKFAEFNWNEFYNLVRDVVPSTWILVPLPDSVLGTGTGADTDAPTHMTK